MAPTRKRTTTKALGQTSRRKATIKGSVTSDTVLRGNSYLHLPTTASDNTDCWIILLGAGLLPSSVSSSPGYVSSSSLRTVTSLYQEYVYTSGTTLHWEPRVPLTTTGSYSIAWLDNPEMIVAFLQGTSATRKAIARALTAKVYPIWQASTTGIGAPRRKMFNVDSSPTLDTSTAQGDLNSTFEIERSIQGAWIYLVEGPTAGTQVAAPYISEVVKLKGITGVAIV